MAKHADNKVDEREEEMTVTLTLEDDSELECAVLTIFEAVFARRRYGNKFGKTVD